MSLRVSRRFSSLVDVNRTTKRNSRSKVPLTLLVLGQSGLGISTLVDMILFDVPQRETRYFSVDKNGEEKEVTESEINSTGLFYREISAEVGGSLKLTFLDFQGLEEPNNRVIVPIVEMIKKRFASFLESNDIEFMVRANISKEKHDRKKIDNRIHGCIYLVPPGAVTNGDVKSMKLLADVINLIPIIARADSLTEAEAIRAKDSLADVLDSSEVPCYGNAIPTAISADPESQKMVEVFAQLSEKMPFAVISSTQVFKVDGKEFFGREYSWGIVDATDEKISDIVSLQILIENNADDLKLRTNDVVYEEYRRARLAALKIVPGSQSS